VIAGIAHNLGGRIKAHWLGIEQRGSEGSGMMIFDPRRDIDQLGKAGGMAFRKSIGTETLDLFETGFGECLLIAAPRHAINEDALVIANSAHMAKSGHGAA